MIYISEKFNYLVRNDLQLLKDGLESTFIEVVNEKSRNIIIGCIYRHPSFDIDSFNTMYSDLIEKINSKNKEIVLMVDFNINLLNSDSNSQTGNFLNLNLENYLKPFIIKPTRKTSHSKTLIDNIFSNYSKDSFVAGNLICSISDHLPQILLLGIETNKTKKERI